MGSGNLDAALKQRVAGATGPKPPPGGELFNSLKQQLATQQKLLTPPPSAPDLTDIAVMNARRMQLNQLLGGRGRASSFLSGSAPTSLLGG